MSLSKEQEAVIERAIYAIDNCMNFDPCEISDLIAIVRSLRDERDKWLDRRMIELEAERNKLQQQVTEQQKEIESLQQHIANVVEANVERNAEVENLRLFKERTEAHLDSLIARIDDAIAREKP